MVIDVHTFDDLLFTNDVERDYWIETLSGGDMGDDPTDAPDKAASDALWGAEHNEFCRAIVQRATPFRSATTDAGQVWGRCNIDFQFMLRTIDPDVLFHDDGAEQPVPQVKPELALALYGVRAQLPNALILRRCFHSIVAMFQAAHNCD